MPTTEVLTVTLLPGSNFSNADNSASVVIKQTINLVSQQDGCEQIYFGTRVDDSEVLQMMIDWDRLESHQKFTTQDYYQPFVNRFLATTIGSNSMFLYHVDFEPSGALTNVLSDPVSTILSLHFGPQGPPSDFAAAAKTLMEELEASDSGCLHHAFGLTLEEIEHGGAQGRVLMFIIGWEGSEAHRSSSRSAAAEDHARRLIDGVIHAESHPVQFTKHASP